MSSNAPPRANWTNSVRSPPGAFFASFATGSLHSMTPVRSVKVLKGDRFGGFWRYRIGDYRVIARIDDAAALVLVLRIGHRREVNR